LQTIDSNAFSTCTGLVKVDLSNCTSLITLSDCFPYCYSLTTIVFPSSLQIIEKNAFSTCTGLVKVDLSNCISLITLSDCFIKCSKLTTVIIPPSLQTIGNYTFAFCARLTNIDFSKCISLTSLGKGCFYQCYSLTQIIIPGSVITINSGAFESCTSLNKVTFLGNTIPSLSSKSFFPIAQPSTAYYQSSVTNLSYLKSFNFFTYYIPLNSYYYPVYPPYLQPTSSLGSGSRISGSISLGSRPKIGGISRIYNYYHFIHKENEFLNNIVFQIYSKK